MQARSTNEKIPKINSFLTKAIFFNRHRVQSTKIYTNMTNFSYNLFCFQCNDKSSAVKYRGQQRRALQIKYGTILETFELQQHPEKIP